MKRVRIFLILIAMAALAGCTADGGDAQSPAETPGAATAQTEQPEATPEAAETPAAAAAPAATQAADETAVAAYRTISPEDAKALIGTEGVTLLDVRTQEEFDEAHIEGAALLPYDAIAQNADKLPQDKDAMVIVYCRSGRRSAIAAQELISMGYTNVLDLGGIQDWPYETVAG